MRGFFGVINKKQKCDSITNNGFNTVFNPIKTENYVWVNDDGDIKLGYRPDCLQNDNTRGNVFLDRTKRFAVLFYGRIYNCESLAEELRGKGCLFSTPSETELIMHLYITYGKNFFVKLDGAFAICIVDMLDKKVLLARDRFGMRSLYYYEDKNIIMFASDLKVFKHLLKLDINYKSVELYFYLRFIPAPYTIYEKIYSVMAGEYVYLDRDCKKRVNFYSYNQKQVSSFSVKKTRTILERSILNTFAVEPNRVGLFLSGGIDSGIIAYFLRNHLQNGNLVFNINYANQDCCDIDSLVVQNLTRELNIKHQHIVLSNNVLDYVSKIICYLEQPLYSSVSISTYCLAQKASFQLGSVLTGDGSDESIFSYKYLRNALNSNNVYSSYLSGIGWLKYIDLPEIFEGCSLSKDEVLNILLSGCEISNETDETLRRVELFKRLPDYHMTRVGKLTNVFDIESRCPYLRNEYVDYMLGIRSYEFLKNEDAKLVLKNALGNSLPVSLTSTVKQPFTAPIQSWIENELKNDVYRLFQDTILHQKVHINSKRIKKLLDAYAGTYADVSNIWGVYILLKWCELDLY